MLERVILRRLYGGHWICGRCLHEFPAQKITTSSAPSGAAYNSACIPSQQQRTYATDLGPIPPKSHSKVPKFLARSRGKKTPIKKAPIFPETPYKAKIFSRERAVARNRDAEEAAKSYVPRGIPVSPLMDPNKYIKPSRRYTKEPPPKGNEVLTPFEEAVRENPYAKMLATPVRNDVDFFRRVPNAFLQIFTMLKHPEASDPWLLPDRILEGTESRRSTGLQGRYALNQIEFVRLLGKKSGWKKLMQEQDRSKQVVWREDMPEFLLGQLRGRLGREVAKVTKGMFVPVGKNEEGWDPKDVWCVLDWSENEEREECRTNVEGRTLPLHYMTTLLGKETVKELREKLEIGSERTWVKRHHRTVGMCLWLMKVRCYLEIW
ncbi:hypothetical protein RUND412_006013 [Rhizina undulata]